MGTILKGTWKKRDYNFIHELDDGVKGYIAGLIDGEWPTVSESTMPPPFRGDK